MSWGEGGREERWEGAAARGSYSGLGGLSP